MQVTGCRKSYGWYKPASIWKFFQINAIQWLKLQCYSTLKKKINKLSTCACYLHNFSTWELQLWTNHSSTIGPSQKCEQRVRWNQVSRAGPVEEQPQQHLRGLSQHSPACPVLWSPLQQVTKCFPSRTGLHWNTRWSINCLTQCF